VELVRHRGEIGYVLSSFDGLSVVDLSDPASPVELGWIPTGEGQFVEDIELPPGQGTLAYLAAGERGIVIADLGDPANPVEVGTFPEEPVGVWDLALDGERLYAVTSDGVQVFDVSDPASPEALGLREATADFFPATVAAADGAVALADSLNAIELVDMTDPELPVDLGRLETADSLYGQRTSLALTEADERTVAVSSQEHFGGRVAVIDVEPGAPAEISSYQTRPQVRIGGVTVTGDLALVAYQEDGLRLLDLSDPESPVEVGHFRSFLGTDPADGLAIRDGAVAADVDLERGLVLLADATRGLLVLSLDDPLVLAALRR
jgi:hypothetical protein